jgi:hypothetical protein
MKVLICGDRNWKDKNMINSFIFSLPKGTIIIEGAAKGADIMAKEAAIAHGLKYEEYIADWDKYQRAAGPIRNQQQLVEGKPDFVIAYHNDIKNSKGTRHMISISLKNKVPCYLNVEDWFDIKGGLIDPLIKENL